MSRDPSDETGEKVRGKEKVRGTVLGVVPYGYAFIVLGMWTEVSGFAVGVDLASKIGK